MAANSALGATKLFAPPSTDPPVDTDKKHLSKKKIPREERLIFALDVPEDRARELISQLGDSVRFYKLGLQLFMSGSYFALLEELTEQKKKVFIDLKFFDVPETVALAVAQLRGRGATFVSVHGNEDILKAACDEENGVQIIAVTVLTSFDQRDLNDLGFPLEVSVEDLVLSRARRALKVGCQGVISSGIEAPRLRDELGDNFLILTPGIRPFENRLLRHDDQKRILTPRQSFLRGADYVVVGRPIRDAEDPRKAAEKIQETIADLFPE